MKTNFVIKFIGGPASGNFIDLKVWPGPIFALSAVDNESKKKVKLLYKQVDTLQSMAYYAHSKENLYLIEGVYNDE